MVRELAADLNLWSSESSSSVSSTRSPFPSQQWVQLLTTDAKQLVEQTQKAEGAEWVKTKQRGETVRAEMKASQPFAVEAGAAPSFPDFYLQPLSECSWNCQFCWYELKATWQMVFSRCCNYLWRRKQAAAFGTALISCLRKGNCNFTCWVSFCWCAVILKSMRLGTMKAWSWHSRELDGEAGSCLQGQSEHWSLPRLEFSLLFNPGTNSCCKKTLMMFLPQKKE